MAKHVLTNALIAFGGYDLSGDMNSAQLELGVDPVEVTCFGAAAHNFLPGLKISAFSGAGYFNVGSADAPLAAAIAAGGQSDILLAGYDAAVGSVAYGMRALLSEYRPRGGVGEAFEFDLGVASRGVAERLQIEVLQNLTADGASAGVQLGAPSASQSLVVVAMTTGAVTGSSPTLNFFLESDDNSDFSSAVSGGISGQKSDRFQFRDATDPGAPGHSGNDWWRLRWVVGGSSSPTFPVVAAFGIVDV